MTPFPVRQETLVPLDRRATLEIQVIQDSRVLLVSVVSLDLMELKGTKDIPDFLDHLDDKDFKVLVEIPEKKDLKASVMEEIQALQGSLALLV